MTARTNTWRWQTVVANALAAWHQESRGISELIMISGVAEFGTESTIEAWDWSATDSTNTIISNFYTTCYVGPISTSSDTDC